MPAVLECQNNTASSFHTADLCLKSELKAIMKNPLPCFKQLPTHLPNDGALYSQLFHQTCMNMEAFVGSISCLA